ncbi:hypothetical protein GBAR_LOCUS25487 [Geodia barretti]|uniref:Uncharacterized protein n=1 Tax=Geodia barretti TaxID=519541 RepID=A0AA35TDS4_GEOBA|nr:hypothetical protein GBAR_LOCUS25487 [Geodia barretti]
MYKQISFLVYQQNEEYEASLRLDRAKERQRFLRSQLEHEQDVERRMHDREEREEQDRLAHRELRIENWYRQIRLDLFSRVTAEPPEGLQGIVHLRNKLPDGTRLSRRFYGNQLMETAAEDDEDPNNEHHDTEAEVTEQVEVVDLTFSPKRNE